MAICRLCKEYEYTGPLGGSGSMVKYGPRHYAHGNCAIDRWGAEILTKMPTHQLGKLPFMRLQEAGLLDLVRAKVEAYEADCKRRDDEWKAKMEEDPSV
jgi:hypothetical protein